MLYEVDDVPIEVQVLDETLENIAMLGRIFYSNFFRINCRETISLPLQTLFYG